MLMLYLKYALYTHSGFYDPYLYACECNMGPPDVSHTALTLRRVHS